LASVDACTEHTILSLLYASMQAHDFTCVEDVA